MSCFHAYGQVSQRLKKIILYFHTKNKKKIKYVLACIFALISSLLKPWELGQYFKKYPKNIFFSFKLWDYEFIRKTCSCY